MINVRFAKPDDATSIRDICATAWQETYKELESSSYIEQVITEFYNIERIKAECSTSSSSWHGYIVAEINGEVKACIGGAVDDDKIGHIYVLYAHPNFKRQGLGKALLNFLTTYQKEYYQITKQRVTVTAGNQQGIPFYNKAGFKINKIEDNWQKESRCKVIIYERSV